MEPTPDIDAVQNPNFDASKVASVENPLLRKIEEPVLREKTSVVDPVSQIREREAKILTSTGRDKLPAASLDQRTEQAMIREIGDEKTPIERRRALYDSLSPEARRFTPAPPLGIPEVKPVEKPVFLEDQKANDEFWEREKGRKEDREKNLRQRVESFVYNVKQRLFSREPEKVVNYDDEIVYQPLEIRREAAREYIKESPSGLDAQAEDYIKKHFGEDLLPDMRGMEEFPKKTDLTSKKAA